VPVRKIEWLEKSNPNKSRGLYTFTTARTDTAMAWELRPASGIPAASRLLMIMDNAIASYIEWKSRTQTSGVAPKAKLRPEAEPRDQRLGFTKVFRWPVPAVQTPLPTSVEVVGSFTAWRKVSLVYDKVTRTWQVALHNVPGNQTHRYVLLVDGKPSYDKTCDGLTAPEGPEETKWQIATPRGPRVMLLFSQTK
jgi:hypothetical protein